MYNNIPLTREQSDFAAQCHNLVYAFLNKNAYPEDKYYDVVIFAYLQAVRAYHERAELRQYAFSTIAFSRMRSAVGNQAKSEARRPITVPLQENMLVGSYPSPELMLIEREHLAA